MDRLYFIPVKYLEAMTYRKCSLLCSSETDLWNPAVIGRWVSSNTHSCTCDTSCRLL